MAKDSDKVKKKTNNTTLYIPRKDYDFTMRALKAMANRIYGTHGENGKVSPYLIGLARQHWVKEGLMSPHGDPNWDKLEKIEKDNEQPKDIWNL